MLPQPPALPRPSVDPEPDRAAPTLADRADASGGSLEETRTRYPYGRTFSPLSPPVIEQLRDVIRRHPQRRDDVFAKIGDSVTASPFALTCFSGAAPLAIEPEAWRGVLARFRGGNAGTGDPFQRASVAARAGWSAWQALAGAPSPLERELATTQARWALVQFGTNDVQIGSLHHYADRMAAIVERLLASGTIPLLFTVMPRADDRAKHAAVLEYNAALRVVAELYQVPLVDYYAELAPLPGWGLASDGIHPSVYRGPNGAQACDLSPVARRSGFNLRNALSLEALARVTAAVEGVSSPEPEPPAWPGSGTEADPLRAPHHSSVFSGVVSVTPDAAAGAPCPGERTPSGRSLFLRLPAAETRPVRIIGFDFGDVSLDLKLLGARGECLGWSPRRLLQRVSREAATLVVTPVGPGSRARFGIVLLRE